MGNITKGARGTEETAGLTKYNKKLHKSTKTNQFMSEYIHYCLKISKSF